MEYGSFLPLFLVRADLSIAIDPRDSRILYVGAWAVARDVDGGVFKSEDGGEHWKLLDGTKKLSVRSLAIAPCMQK